MKDVTQRSGPVSRLYVSRSTLVRSSVFERRIVERMFTGGIMDCRGVWDQEDRAETDGDGPPAAAACWVHAERYRTVPRRFAPGSGWNPGERLAGAIEANRDVTAQNRARLGLTTRS